MTSIMSRLSTIAAALLLPMIALAEGGGGAHHAGGIPQAVILQAINFLIFVGLVVFLMRKKVVDYFKGRKEEFKQALVKAEHARNEAEKQKRIIQERLSKLDATSNQSLEQARAEAAALKQRIMQEAEQLTANLREEAARTAKLEIERARHEVREELLSASVALSKKMLEEKMAEPDQKRLQTEFVDKIQVVR